MKLEYLHLLYRVIKESTICLMGHERRQTLLMVENLRNTLEQMQCFNNQDQLCYAQPGTVYYNTEEINKNGYSAVYYMNSSTPTVVIDSSQASETQQLLPETSGTITVSEKINEKENLNNIIEKSNSTNSSDENTTIKRTTTSPISITKDLSQSILPLSSYVPRQTLLYFPPNGTGFEMVGLCEC